jgi:hypothetical protein
MLLLRQDERVERREVECVSALDRARGDRERAKKGGKFFWPFFPQGF